MISIGLGIVLLINIKLKRIELSSFKAPLMALRWD